MKLERIVVGNARSKVDCFFWQANATLFQDEPEEVDASESVHERPWPQMFAHILYTYCIMYSHSYMCTYIQYHKVTYIVLTYVQTHIV